MPKNKWKTGTFLLVTVLICCGKITLAQSVVRVGVITGGSPAAEEQAWLDFADHQNWQVKRFTWQGLLENRSELDALDVLWYHQTDTTVLAPLFASALQAFLARGGQMLLSMEALHLVNAWGVEPNTLQTRLDTVFDEGFGRPRGFHAFKDHPLFARLHGGAYPWKAKTDHVARLTGFFDENLPANPHADVLGVRWTYITFHPQEKLVLEYPVGQGRILGIGAYTYFAPQNDNRLELEKLYQNAMDYLQGNLNGPIYTWKYQDWEVKQQSALTSGQVLPAATPWGNPELTLTLQRQEATDAFVSLAGRRLLLMGKENGGIDEIWTHPFMAVRDLRVRYWEGDSLRRLEDLPVSITVSPELILREYTLNGQTLREFTTVSFDQPWAVVHYEWPPDFPIDQLVVEATFNARYMWPYDANATRDIRYHYQGQSLVVEAQDSALVTWLTFSKPPLEATLGRYSGFTPVPGQHLQGDTTGLLQLGTCFSLALDDRGGSLNIMVGGTAEGPVALQESYRRLLPQVDTLYRVSGRYYRELFQRTLQITTPDSVFNVGYRWAIARTDQLFQETPGIGTTHMAGFGTTARGWNGRHDVSGRPGYAWYFGRDGEWSGMAVNAYGDPHWVQEMLRVYARYQHPSGKIYHELTTSGAVHYDAADATPLYVVLAAHYLRYSGDLALIRELWPSLERAIRYAASTDTDNDGLIENTNVGHGWIEGGVLFGVHTEFYLAGSWAACLDAAAYLCEQLGEHQEARIYAQQAQAVKKIIDQQFWNDSESYFYNGKMSDGTYQQDATVLQAVPVYLGAVDDMTKARAAIQPFGGRAMTADWGIRMIAEDHPRFNPRSYHAGMVWPLYGGWASLAEYALGFDQAAFFHVYANLINYRYWALGSIEETLHGTAFHPAGVCSQQCWSETMVLLPLLEGMLGMRADAPRHSLALQPVFPLDWQAVEVGPIRLGGMQCSLTWEQRSTETLITVTRKEDSDPMPLTIRLSPTLPLGMQVSRIAAKGGKGKRKYRIYSEPEGNRLAFAPFALRAGETRVIRIRHQGGAGVVPLTIFPEENASSQGLRYLSQQWNNDRWQGIFEGVPGKSYALQVWSASAPLSIENGVLLRREGLLNTIAITCPTGTAPNSQIAVIIVLPAEK